MKREKIAILAGGPSCEREVSLVSGRAVEEALRSKGFPVFLLDPVGDFMEALKREAPDLVFIALHGTFGEDGTVQRLLEREGLVYTGPGPIASENAFDKSRAQLLFRSAGIPVPEFIILKKGETPERLDFSFPVVVKPASAGSSVGITMVSDRGGLRPACEEAFRYSETVLIERYVRGRELTVGILDGEPLPIVEVIAQRAFYDYEAKYGNAGTRYEVPARLDATRAALVSAAALAAHRALGCEVMSRVDIILEENGNPFVLEVNTIPGLTGKSLLPKAAKASGMDFPDLCVKILEISEKVRGHDKKIVSPQTI